MTKAQTMVAPPSSSLETPASGTGLTITLISILVLSALAGLGGGLSMIFDPTGAALGIEELVGYLPVFDDYLGPGVLLIILQGLVPLVLAVGLATGFSVPFLAWAERLTRYRWPVIGTTLLGVGVVAWILVQFWVLPELAVAQLVILAIGVAIVVLAALPSVRERYRID